ncbi:MAG: SDR family oxidoreductase [Spirochaetota bacterium]|nr:MAG: SDR family oxidoreductase [Spirochaetota bacterium]
MDLMLQDKIAIVTGSRGICKETALTLAEEGANLAITYVSEDGKISAEDSVKKINKMGKKAIALRMNNIHLKEIETMVDSVIEEYGKIDILVNCAGVCTPVLAQDTTEEQFDFDIGTDLKGLFFCSKEVFNKSMKKQNSGNIINISSVIGVAPIKTNPVYGAAKAGVLNITRYLAIEWGPYGVRVNAVSPGWIATELLLRYQREGKSADPNSVTRCVPLGRFGEPREIADTVAFLASEKSSFTTGANVVVDGGIIAGIRLSSFIDGKIEVL